MQTFLNETGVPLSVAVYLATDHYDYVPNAISATSLLKPLRQQILPARVPKENKAVDVLSVVKSRIGTAIHDGVEKAWTGGHYKQAMRDLGYPSKIIERVVINHGYKEDETGNLVPDPDAGPLPEGAIPVYMEIRSFRELNGYRISGKFDFVAEGRVEDFKSTSTYTWMLGTKTEDYQLQGSIYRWLNRDIITQDHMAIQFFFTDWMAGKAKIEAKKGYPPRQVETQKIPLLSLDDTEQFIANKLMRFELYKDKPESEIPECTDDELWRKDPVWKYYKDPNKRTRSTKNFDNAAEANKRLMDDGNVGVVVEVKGEVVACRFCAAFDVCKQKDRYLADGTLNL